MRTSLHVESGGRGCNRLFLEAELLNACFAWEITECSCGLTVPYSPMLELVIWAFWNSSCKYMPFSHRQTAMAFGMLCIVAPTCFHTAVNVCFIWHLNLRHVCASLLCLFFPEPRKWSSDSAVVLWSVLLEFPWCNLTNAFPLASRPTLQWSHWRDVYTHCLLFLSPV